MFHAQFMSGERFEQPTTKVVCVGRNYAEHARELDNPIPDEPILFIKPETSITHLSNAFAIPETDCHYEAEVSVLIGKELSNASKEDAELGIAGIGLALDLTRRSLQSELKKKSHPWEIAKGFDGACPMSEFVTCEHAGSLEKLNFSLSINNELRQQGNTSDMLTPVLSLISYISQYFTLRAGDIILTGTPKGVGLLSINDEITLHLNGELLARSKAVQCK